MPRSRDTSDPRSGPSAETADTVLTAAFHLLVNEGVTALTTEDCTEERYGFIGDYIGLAADRNFAYAAWADLRDLVHDAGVCAGHSCNGRRNQNVYFARIPKN